MWTKPEEAQFKLEIFTELLRNSGDVNTAVSQVDSVYNALIGVKTVIKDGELVQTVAQAMKGSK